MSDVYISGSLKHTPKEWWNIYEKIGKVVEEFGLSPYIPHIHTPAAINSTADHIVGTESESVHTDVFHQDKKTVENCKLVIAEVSNPSTGSGIEIGWSMNLGKPIICMAHKNAKVTALITGPSKSGLINLIRYENEEDALSQLKNLLETKFKALI